MNRLKIYVLNKPAGVYNEYVDIPSLLSYLKRIGEYIHNYTVVATKGKKSLHFEKLDPATLIKELTEFQNQP